VGKYGYKLIIIGALILYFLLTTGSIFTKLPWVDEALFASPAVNLVSHGYMGTTVMETAGTRWQGIERRTYWMVPLHFLAQAGWYELFGFSLFSMRALSQVWGLFALAALYSIALILSGNRHVAALAAVLIAFDSSFIAAGSSGRMDMMNAALGVSGLAAYLYLRESHLQAAVLASHGLVCASALTHPNGILYFTSLILMMVYFDRRRLSFRDLAFATAPYVLGALAWGLYISQDPTSFLAQFTANIQSGARLSYLKAPWAGLWSEITHRYLGYFGLAEGSKGLSRLKLVIPFVHGLGLAGLLSSKSLRSRAGYRALLLVAAVQFVVLAVYDAQKLPYYLIHTVPLLNMFLAIWLVSIWSMHATWRPLLAALLLGFIGVQLLISINRIKQNPYYTSYLPAVEFLRKNAGHKALIVGTAALDFALGFNGNVLDDPRLGYHSGKTPDFIVVGDVDFREYFRGFASEEPAVYRYVTARLLNEYRPVYNQAGEEIYIHR